MAKKPNPSGPAAKPAKTTKYVSQQDIPSLTLERALKIPRAIAENYGNEPASPLEVASALEVQPDTGGFRSLVGASSAYGLTSSSGDRIEITALGNRIVRPTAEDDDIAAKREALLRPRVLREFLQKYDNNPIPSDSIARNVLNTMGVPNERTAGALKLILDQVQELGLIKEISGKRYVYLKGVKITTPAAAPAGEFGETEDTDDLPARAYSAEAPKKPPPALPPGEADPRLKRVYITHGKNRAFVDPIKELLKFGELEAVVSVEKQTVAQPVPKKVMEDMRSCGAAIIHIEDELKLIDKEAKEYDTLNENVLIEIGAAMALYGERYIFLVKEDVKLPSNIQGLYEVRYSDENMDSNETIKLLGAIRDLKGRPLP